MRYREYQTTRRPNGARAVSSTGPVASVTLKPLAWVMLIILTAIPGGLVGLAIALPLGIQRGGGLDAIVWPLMAVSSFVLMRKLRSNGGKPETGA